jgi:hypothetical protein
MYIVFQSQDALWYEATLEYTPPWPTLLLWGGRLWFLMSQCLWVSQALWQGMWLSCDFILPRNPWKCIFIKPSILSLLIFAGFVALPLSISILAGRHTCSMRTLPFQNWTIFLKLSSIPVVTCLRSSLACPKMSMNASLLCHYKFCFGKNKTGINHCLVVKSLSVPSWQLVFQVLIIAAWHLSVSWLNLHEVVHSPMSVSHSMMKWFGGVMSHHPAQMI